jgi:TatD DNase family protein
MRLIDTHCHLADGRLRGSAAALLERAREAGVAAVVCAAGDLEEAEAAVELSGRHEGVYVTAGVHPHEAKGAAGKEYLGRIESLAGDGRNVAVGEVGLDYHYDYSPRAVQRRVFAEQLELAARLGKPAVIHTREAFDDTVAILRESALAPSRAVFHSCTEAADNMRTIMDLGSMVSFSGIVTFKKSADLHEAARLPGDDRILIETDAPYLSPEPVRKMRTNEPANVAHVAACLAAVRGTSAEAFAELTTANACRFFALVLPGVTA